MSFNHKNKSTHKNLMHMLLHLKHVIIVYDLFLVIMPIASRKLE
jgi:hypothetical protein